MISAFFAKGPKTRAGRKPALASATALGLTLFAAPALAQEDARALAAAARCQPAAPTAIEEGRVLFQSESLTYDTENAVITAEGRVEVAYFDCILVADHLAYDQRADKVTARGDVAIMEPSGHVIFADEIELGDGLESGVIEHFSALLKGNTRFAARRATRTPGRVTKLERVVYSPCRVCEEEGFSPLWQIRAFRVTHNEGAKTISYRDAIVEVKGVPVFYLPYFQHADPSVARKSGLLVPTAGNATDLGNFVELPFYWAIAPNHDVTFSPLFTSREGTVLKAEYRRRTKHGRYSADGSFTNIEIPSSDGSPAGDETFRSHLFTNGYFRVTDVWRWGFDVRLTSDDTYLERYDISDLDRLKSQVFAEAFAGRDYASINGFYFQGLRASDDPGTTPFILPLGELVWYPKERPLGGTLRVDANVLALRRSEGADSQRLSVSGRWDRQFIIGNGQILTGSAELRGDVYHTSDVNPLNDPALPEDGQIIARFLPTLGIEWRYPFARVGERSYQVIEPIAQLFVSPYGGNDEDIPNEDGASFEFDDTNLFVGNKLPGLDLWESGPRANIGIRYGYFRPEIGEVEFVFGQNFRLKEDSVFDPSTGLGDQQSDYVGRLTVAPTKFIDLTHRFRIDRENLDFSRNEVTGRVGTDDYWARVSYVRLSEELSASGLDAREELAVNSRLKIAGNWFFEGRARRDLDNDKMISSGAAIVFDNECVEFKLQFKRRFTRDRDIEPSSTFNIRLRLRTFGESPTN